MERGTGDGFLTPYLPVSSGHDRGGDGGQTIWLS